MLINISTLDGQLLLPRVVAPPSAVPEDPVKSQWGINNVSPIMLKKRTYEQNGRFYFIVKLTLHYN